MKVILKYRKGQQQLNIASIGTIALTLVVAAVVLGLGATILDKIQGTQTDNTGAYGNQTLVWAGNNTLIGLQPRIVTSSVALYNNGSIVNPGAGVSPNYTVSTNGITIINTSSGTGGLSGGPKGINSSDWITDKLNCSYNYYIGSDAYNSTQYGLAATTTVAEFIPTIAIVAAAAIVIGIILVFFGRKREEM